VIYLFFLATPLVDPVATIRAHIAIQDYEGACQEAEKADKTRPVQEAYLAALSKNNDENKLLAVWKQYRTSREPSQEVIEDVAWGVLNQGITSSQPMIRAMGLVGASLSQDVRGVRLIKRATTDPCVFVRALAAEFAGHTRDLCLQQEMLRMFIIERDWQVRQAVIEAIGHMRIQGAAPHLRQRLTETDVTPEERLVLIEAIVNILDNVEDAELQYMASHERAGFRQLACLAIAHFNRTDKQDLLEKLVQDPRAEVRQLAYMAYGRLRLPVPKREEREATTALFAAWAIMLEQPLEGQKRLRPFLQHANEEIREMALAALVRAGKYAFPLAEELFFSTRDPYVQINLGLLMMGQRQHTERASHLVFSALMNTSERIMWKQDKIFRYLTKSDLKHREGVPHYPDAVDQMTRLEILGQLAIVRQPGVQEALTQFLREKTWGISGIASLILLTEGDDSVLEAIAPLISHPDSKVQLQAAIVMAAWGQEEKALPMLTQAYATASRQRKEQILEALGSIGAKESLPFLMDRLDESYQTLRLIAAAGILQTLYK